MQAGQLLDDLRMLVRVVFRFTNTATSLPATILDLCGLPVPDTYQGKSMVPLIEGRQTEWREDVFCEDLFTDQGYPRMEAVRGKQWKYIRYFSYYPRPYGLRGLRLTFTFRIHSKSTSRLRVAAY